MIKGLRVDHRLLHGQVAVSWFSSLDANTILIANDDVAKDEFRKSAMRLAKPHNAKLVMKDLDYSIQAIKEGLTDKYDLFVVVESVQDAYRLIKETGAFKELNLGGTKATSETRNVSKAVNLSQDEEKLLDELVSNGIEIEIRQVPNDKKLLYIDTK